MKKNNGIISYHFKQKIIIEILLDGKIHVEVFIFTVSIRLRSFFGNSTLISTMNWNLFFFVSRGPKKLAVITFYESPQKEFSLPY